MMRTVALLATATAIVGTASVGIGTTGVSNVVIGNGGDGEQPSCCSLLFVTRTSPGPTGMTTLSQQDGNDDDDNDKPRTFARFRDKTTYGSG